MTGQQAFPWDSNWPPSDAPAAWSEPPTGIPDAPGVEPPGHQEDDREPGRPLGAAPGYAEGTDPEDPEQAVVGEHGVPEQNAVPVHDGYDEAIHPGDAIDPAGEQDEASRPVMPGTPAGEVEPGRSELGHAPGSDSAGDGDHASTVEPPEHDNDNPGAIHSPGHDPHDVGAGRRHGDMPDGSNERPDLDRMSKSGLVEHGRERYGLTLNPRAPKDELIGAIRAERDK